RHISDKQWITTNYIANTTNSDPRRTEKLDFSSYTRYPVDGYGYNVGEQGFRIGHPMTMDFAGDFYRPMDGKTGIMELQPGQVNWGQINPQPAPGAVRMWLWHAFASRCNFACTYRYRQPLYGSEQYHYGIVGPDGVTPLPGGKEYAQVAAEMKELREVYNPKNRAPENYLAKKTAILWSHDNNWDIEYQKRNRQWNMHGHVQRYQTIIKSFGGPVDYIAEEDDYSDYPFVIIPAYQLVDTALIEKWTAYANNGGNLIVTCRTGHKDKMGHLFEAPYADMISDLIGAKVEKYDLLLENVEAYIERDGSKYAWTTWGDILTPDEGTQELATYADQFYQGKPAATFRKLGKGTVTYIGAHTKTGELEKDILAELYQNQGVEIENYPEGVLLQWRDGFWVALNYSSTPYELTIPEDAEILFGEKTIPSPGVTVWTEK
ncbi:MAG: beta-galactosidase, partial [Bacteroidota bacterium]